MSSCAVAVTNNSPSSICSPKSSSPRLIRFHKPSGLVIRALTAASDSSSTVLKRKRPPQLDIPVVVPMAENKAAVQEAVEVDGDGYSVCCKRGRRHDEMEDRYSAVIGLQDDPIKAIFGIFDGHGGKKAAEYASENLDKNIINELRKRDQSDDGIELAVKNGYLTTHSEFLKKELREGTCCVTAIITGDKLVVSNAGDCRAVVSRKGAAEALTSDHRPSREDEKHRIETLGGFVECRNGVWRVLGCLAVSRAIGDRYLKQWISAEPETTVLNLEPEYEFLILASDGFWDKVSNQEAVNIVRPMCIDIDKPQPVSACRKLVELSVSRGSSDDISVMLIQLGKFC